MNEAADGLAPAGDVPSLPPDLSSPAPCQNASMETADDAAPAAGETELHAIEGDGSAQPASGETIAARPAEGRDATAVVRYGCMRHVGQLRHSLQPPPRRGDKVVIRTERGVELGEVMTAVGQPCSTEGRCDTVCLGSDRLESFLACNGRDYPFNRDGRILRLASPQDISDQEHLDRAGVEQLAYCKQEAARLNLPMRMVAVEDLLGGERVIFYFTSETRVDFRELVRHLASQYRTRIEMRQVGARDEARLVADYERCGQRCCCQQFIKSLQPVSIRMAKTQKATLDPSKISGRCGRLMCCLRYEDTGYEELRALLPRKNTWVRTAELTGRVLDGQILTQLVRLVAADGTLHVVANEAILERNVAPPPPAELRDSRSAPSKWPSPRPVAQPRPQESYPEPAEEPVEQAEPEQVEEPVAEQSSSVEMPAVAGPATEPGEARPTGEGSGEGSGAGSGVGKKRRRRRRRSKGAQAAGATGQPPSAPAPSPAGSPAPGASGEGSAGGQKKRRRRHRRRGGGPAGPASPPPTAPAS